MASNISYNSYWGYYGINWASASGNNNIIYSGQGDTHLFRSRIVLNTSNMVINSSTKLVVKITVAQQGSQYYDHTVARLSTHNLKDPGEYFENDGYTPKPDIKNSTISWSKFYTDSNGNSPVGSAIQALGNTLYLVFDTGNNIKAGEKYYIYIGREGTSSSRFNAFQASEINLTYESYTACGAPTSVWTNDIITPDGTFTVSWSGATAGSANTIVGYDIYYHITLAGSVPTTSTYTGMVQVGLTSTSGSKEIEVKGATRGYKIVCGVVTRGSAGAAYYSGMKTGGSVTINTLPNPPTVSASTTLITSSSKGVYLTATPGASNDAGQTSSVYYSTSANGNKNEYTNSITANPDEGKSVTYYFWTWDGLEYSSVVSRTITKNSKPTVSLGVSGTLLKSSNNDTGYSYITSPTVTATRGNNGQNSDNKYTFKLKYGAEPSDLNLTKTYSAQSSNTLKISEIRNIIGVNKYYKFSVIRNDGIENSEEVIDSNIYYITPMPKIKNFYNIAKAETVAPENYFSKKVRIHVDNDEGYNSIKLLANDTEFGTETKLSISPNNSNQNFANYDCSSLASAQEYSFKIKFISSTGYSITTDVIKTLTKINSYSSELKLNWSGTTKPFTTKEENPTFTNIFGSSNIQWEQWGFAKEPSFTLSSFYNDKEAGTITIAPTFNYSSGILKLTGENIYKLFTAKKIIDVTSLNDFSTKITLTTTNSFGDIYSWNLNNKTINFKEEIEIEEYVLNLNQDNNPSIFPQCLKEGVCPYLTIVCKSYQGPPNILKVVGLSGNNLFYTYENTNEWSIKEDSNPLGYGSPISYIFQAPLPTILEQQQDLTENAEFKVTFSLSNKIQSNLSFTKELQIGKHIKGNLSIIDASYTPPKTGEEGSIELVIDINNWGASKVINNKKYKIEIQYKIPNGKSWNICGYLKEKTEPEEKDKISNTEIYNSNFGHNYNILPFISDIFNKYENGNKIGEYDYIKIRLVMTTLAFASAEDAEKIAETSKTFESLEYIIYNTKPTVAYRKNKLGINYDFINKENQEDGVLMVSEYNNLNKIYLLHTEGSRNIDIKSGKLSGFVFNGGVWGEDLGDDGIGVIIGNLPSAEINFF